MLLHSHQPSLCLCHYLHLMACCIINYTSMNNCSYCKTMFSSLASFCTICASTKWCYLVSPSFDSSMHTRSVHVAHVPIYYLTGQCRLLLRKNSITNVLIMSMSWIIFYTNYIFTLYAFPSAHSKDDDECGNDLTSNGWIFNTPLFAIFNSYFVYLILNNFVFSSCLHLCSLLCTSFSLAIHCIFSIALSTFIMLWTPKLWKCAQLSTTNVNCFQQSPCFFSSFEHPAHQIHFFICPPSFN